LEHKVEFAASAKEVEHGYDDIFVLGMSLGSFR
jgi:hypothetical protein